MFRRQAVSVAVCVVVCLVVMMLFPGRLMAACLGAVAELAPRVMPAALRLAAIPENSARITFIGHATFMIESPQGVIAATDYNDYIQPPVRPDIVTMNHAHSTHFSYAPDPAILHVLRGWPHDGKPARHNVQLKDMRVRNVPTNIRGYGETTEYDGNSIFIFDVAGLCIAHLGHLHHKLTPGHLADLGKIDVLFVPVDGGFTLNIVEMREVVDQVKAPLVIPMHYFSEATLERFLARLDGHEIKLNDSATTLVSRASLPRKPTVLVLPGPH
jgi:L-ascorbate metabolism protein UlaG (beta-lactamase superfamily)